MASPSPTGILAPPPFVLDERISDNRRERTAIAECPPGVCDAPSRRDAEDTGDERASASGVSTRDMSSHLGGHSREIEEPSAAKRNRERGEKQIPAEDKDEDRKEGEDKGEKDGKSDEDKKAQETERKRRKRRPWVIAGGAVALLALVAGGVWYWLSTRGKENTDDAYTDGISVTVAPKVAGYVVELLVSDNTRLRAGDLILRIDPRDQIAARDQAQAQLEVVQAQLANAQANLDLAKQTFPARFRQAQAQAEQARAQQDKAAADLKRQRTVDPRGTTQADIDAAVANARVAFATSGQQSANVEINRPVPLNIAISETQVKQAQAQVSQAQAQLEQAALNLSYTEMRAPQDGWVTRRNVYLGSYMQVGQSLFSLVSPNVWVTANFKENQLDRMRPGQSVQVKVDAYPNLKLHGRVDSIQMGSGSKFSAFPAENATGNFIKIVQRVPVKIVLESGMDPNIPLPLGLSVSPTVEVGG